VRIGAAELVSSDIALHLNNDTETFKSAKQEMKIQFMTKFFISIKQAFLSRDPSQQALTNFAVILKMEFKFAKCDKPK